jgi:hypothetical protein
VLKFVEAIAFMKFHTRRIYNFLSDTLTLVARIASIYYPNEKITIEKARLGNVFTALLEINRQVMEFL